MLTSTQKGDHTVQVIARAPQETVESVPIGISASCGDSCEQDSSAALIRISNALAGSTSDFDFRWALRSALVLRASLSFGTSLNLTKQLEDREVVNKMMWLGIQKAVNVGQLSFVFILNALSVVTKSMDSAISSLMSCDSMQMAYNVESQSMILLTNVLKSLPAASAAFFNSLCNNVTDLTSRWVRLYVAATQNCENSKLPLPNAAALLRQCQIMTLKVSQLNSKTVVRLDLLSSQDVLVGKTTVNMVTGGLLRTLLHQWITTKNLFAVFAFSDTTENDVLMSRANDIQKRVVQLHFYDSLWMEVPVVGLGTCMKVSVPMDPNVYGIDQQTTSTDSTGADIQTIDFLTPTCGVWNETLFELNTDVCTTRQVSKSDVTCCCTSTGIVSLRKDTISRILTIDRPLTCDVFPKTGGRAFVTDFTFICTGGYGSRTIVENTLTIGNTVLRSSNGTFVTKLHPGIGGVVATQIRSCVSGSNTGCKTTEARVMTLRPIPAADVDAYLSTVEQLFGTNQRVQGAQLLSLFQAWQSSGDGKDPTNFNATFTDDIQRRIRDLSNGVATNALSRVINATVAELTELKDTVRAALIPPPIVIVKGSAPVVLTDTQREERIANTVSALAFFKESLLVNPEVSDMSDIAQIIGSASSVQASTTGKSETTSTELMKDAVELLTQGAQKLISRGIVMDTAITTPDGVSVSIKSSPPSEAKNQAVSDDVSIGNIAGNLGLKAIFEESTRQDGSSSVTTFTLVLPQNPYLPTNSSGAALGSISSNVVHFSFLRSNGSKISVANLSEPLLIAMPSGFSFGVSSTVNITNGQGQVVTRTTSMKPECVYLEGANTWSSDGCTVSGYNPVTGDVECAWCVLFIL